MTDKESGFCQKPDFWSTNILLRDKLLLTHSHSHLLAVQLETDLLQMGRQFTVDHVDQIGAQGLLADVASVDDQQIVDEAGLDTGELAGRLLRST